MTKKKKDLHSIPTEMQAALNRERERQIQSKSERLEKTLEFVGKKMEAEFVKTRSDDEFVEDVSMSSDELIDPTQKENDSEIVSR